MSYEHGVYNEFRAGSSLNIFELFTPFINFDKNKEYEKLTYLNFHLIKFDGELKFNEETKLAKTILSYHRHQRT